MGTMGNRKRLLSKRFRTKPRRKGDLKRLPIEKMLEDESEKGHVKKVQLSKNHWLNEIWENENG